MTNKIDCTADEKERRRLVYLALLQLFEKLGVSLDEFDRLVTEELARGVKLSRGLERNRA